MLGNGSFPLEYSLNTEEDVESVYYVSEREVQFSRMCNAFEVKKAIQKPKIVKRYTIKKKTVSKENVDTNKQETKHPKSSKTLKTLKTLKTVKTVKTKKKRKNDGNEFSDQNLNLSNFGKTKLVSLCKFKSETKDVDEKGK